MKDKDEIRKDGRVIVDGNGADGMSGFLSWRGKTFRFVMSYGGGWDHVSISMANRCPTWDEMCMVKDIFFREDETCIEYHPAVKDYVNMHPYCLHIWKPQGVEIPKPPKIYV